MSIQLPALHSASIGLVPTSMREGMDLANFMAKAELLPTHLKNKPADCMLVIMQAVKWQMDPFTLAQECAVIHGKMMFSGKLVAGVVNTRGGLSKRLNYAYDGEGPQRKVTVSGTLEGEAEPRMVEVLWSDAKTDNKMWTKQPDQQLMYHGARVWARRHTPEVMLGVYSPEEFEEAPPAASPPIKVIQPPPARHSVTLTRQAGILCGDPDFWEFLTEESDGEVVDTPGRAAVVVRALCGVESRSEIQPSTPAATIWQGLVDDYHVWRHRKHSPRTPDNGTSRAQGDGAEVDSQPPAASAPLNSDSSADAPHPIAPANASDLTPVSGSDALIPTAQQYVERWRVMCDQATSYQQVGTEWAAQRDVRKLIEWPNDMTFDNLKTSVQATIDRLRP